MAERLRFSDVSPIIKRNIIKHRKKRVPLAMTEMECLLALREADCSIVMAEGDRRRCNLVSLGRL